ncbi:hypothetical protein HMPREF0880_04654 [Yokenella regensburgei ATCC 43003]|nr:hypothetical protein HMPREF0880_04654 [Yokenella regensburgei ATCC 43003]
MFAKDLHIIEQNFGQLAVKLTGVQLIVELLPGGDRTGVLIDIFRRSMMYAAQFWHGRRVNLDRQRVMTEMMEIRLNALSHFPSAGINSLPLAPPR